MKFNLSHDFAKSQPTWNATFLRHYGESNEGVIVEADNAETAKAVFCAENNLNPFYVKVKAVK